MMSPNFNTGKRRLRRIPCSLSYLTELIKLRIDKNKHDIDIPNDLEIVRIIEAEGYDTYGFCNDVVYLVCKSREFDIVLDGKEIPEFSPFKIITKDLIICN